MATPRARRKARVFLSDSESDGENMSPCGPDTTIIDQSLVEGKNGVVMTR